MKRIALYILLSLCVALVCEAKEYRVYTIHGKVTRGEKNLTIRAKEYIDENEMITIYEGACLVLYDEKNDEGRRIAIKEIGRQRLGVLIERVDKSAAERFRTFGKMLISTLISGSTPVNTDKEMALQGGSYRADDNDKALLRAVINNYNRQLQGTLIKSDYPISFVIKNSDGNIVTDLSNNDLCTLSVTNGSEEFLFVNALLIHRDRSKQLLLPIDTSNNCCAHLCVPPHTTIDFKQYARFIQAHEGCEVILVATPTEVDFSVLYKDFNTLPQETQNATTTKIGCDIQSYAQER